MMILGHLKTLVISRRSYWVTVFAFLAAFAAAFFVGVQVSEMTDQTQILSSQAITSAANGVSADNLTQKQIKALQDQVNASKGSVAAIQRQMRQDQRAWIQAKVALGAKLTENQPATGKEELINIGKTPAKRIISDIVVELVPNGKEPEFKYSGVARHTDYVGFIYPNTLPEEVLVSTLHKIANNSTETEVTNLTHDDMVSLTEGNSFLVIHSYTRYKDIFGVDHWVKACAWQNYTFGPHTFTAGKCSLYNDVDNN